MCVMIINAVAIFSRNSRRDSWVVNFGVSGFGGGDGNSGGDGWSGWLGRRMVVGGRVGGWN